MELNGEDNLTAGEQNPDTQLQRKRFRLVGLVIVTVLVIFGIILGVKEVYNATHFLITGTTPSASSVNQITPSFKINFNKQLSKTGARVTASSSVTNGPLMKSYTITGSTIDILLNTPLASTQKYTIDVDHITDTKGRVINNYTVSFKPAAANYQSLTENQKQTILKTQQSYKPQVNNPILSHLPYDNLYFDLTPDVTANSQGKTQVTLNANLLINQAQMSDESQAVAQDEQEVQQYIQSLGLNPASYTINYTVTTP